MKEDISELIPLENNDNSTEKILVQKESLRKGLESLFNTRSFILGEVYYHAGILVGHYLILNYTNTYAEINPDYDAQTFSSNKSTYICRGNIIMTDGVKDPKKVNEIARKLCLISCSGDCASHQIAWNENEDDYKYDCEDNEDCPLCSDFSIKYHKNVLWGTLSSFFSSESEIVKTIKRYLPEALVFVQKNWKSITQVAEILLNKKYVDGKEVEKICRQNTLCA